MKETASWSLSPLLYIGLTCTNVMTLYDAHTHTHKIVGGGGAYMVYLRFFFFLILCLHTLCYNHTHLIKKTVSQGQAANFSCHLTILMSAACFWLALYTGVWFFFPRQCLLGKTLVYFRLLCRSFKTIISMYLKILIVILLAGRRIKHSGLNTWISHTAGNCGLQI